MLNGMAKSLFKILSCLLTAMFLLNADDAYAGCDELPAGVLFTPETGNLWIKTHCTPDTQELIRKRDLMIGIPGDEPFNSGKAGITWEEFNRLPRWIPTREELLKMFPEDREEILKIKPLDPGIALRNISRLLDVNGSPSREASPVEHPVYVLNMDHRSISVIDGGKDEVAGSVELSDAISTFQVAPDGNLLIPVNYGGEQELIRLQHVPGEIYLSDDGGFGLVMHDQNGYTYPLTLVDFKNRKELKIFEILGDTRAALFEGDSIWFYVRGLHAIKGGRGAYRIDLKDLSLTKVSDAGEGYRSVLLKNGKVYGLSESRGTLQVIGIMSNEVEKTIQLSGHAYAMAFVEDLLYVTHRNELNPLKSDNRVSIVNTNTYEVEDIIEVGDGPAAICYSRSLGKIYTINSVGVNASSVSVIDAGARKLIKTIALNQRASIVIRCPE